jgi:hypothetical protein
MQTTTASIESNQQYRRNLRVFIVFLVISPILPYVLTMAYNGVLSARTSAEFNSLPSYPGAKLVESGVFQDYSTNRCREWRFYYATTATPKDVGAFYESALLDSGWHRSGGFSGFERYAKSTTNILVKYDNEGKFSISVTADVFPVFEPGCSP